VRQALRRLIKDRSGVTAIEYAVIATLIAVAIVVSASVVGTNLNQTFNTIVVALGGGDGGDGGDGDGGHH
jgi:pilus assembly protein Flp/PilA